RSTAMADTDQEPGTENITVSLIRKILDMTDEQQLSLYRQLEEISATAAMTSEREDTRKSFKKTIQFILKDQIFTGVSQDISAGGMFIITDEAFSIGQMITIQIPLADKGKHIKVPAQIVRIKPEGIGVEFLKKIE
ncbi:MAG: PilZ domain-containing protein, partial [Desulfobacterales bacterium]|nr:PilZ domain-containing protein [Desulfobacterales bacterium]